MSVGPPVGPQLQELVGEGWRQRFRRFDDRLLAWLALLPEWTDRAAGAVGGPWSEVDVAALVDTLQVAEIVELCERLAPDGEFVEVFWVRATARAHLGAYVQTRPVAVLQELTGLFERIQELPAHEREGLEAWIEIVPDMSDPTGTNLFRRVEQAVESGDLPGAARIVAAAECVGSVVGGPLADTARRARWRIDRASREEADRRHLRHYYPPPGQPGRRPSEIERAFTDLLDGPEEMWALHILGDGGVGKTMAIRYLASGGYAQDAQRAPFPVARVDFDHLNPQYPEQRPGELLLALAADLRGFTDTRGGTSWYRRFQDAVHVLHEELAGREPDPSLVEAYLDRAVEQFTSFVSSLPQPVVLVLDTCEELAKLYVPGARAPGIERTFDLLERINRTLRSVRVVLAGRRWLVPPPPGQGRGWGPLLTPRNYLRVLQVSGFTGDEAKGYVTQRQRSRPLDSALVDAILTRSADGDHYNPFDLSCYVGWAIEEPARVAKLLLSKTADPYVAHRIIGRIDDADLRLALPAAAELGRFDVELIEPTVRRRGADPQAVFDKLATQEWVSTAEVTADGRPLIIEVDEHLRERLRAATDDRNEFPFDAARLGEDAASLALSRPLDNRAPDTVEAAIRLLSPPAAAKLWTALEARIAETGEWAVAANITARVGPGEVERARDGGPTILAAIRATQAAARIQLGDHQGLADLWAEVEELVGRHPDEEMAKVLRARAVLGRIAQGALVLPDEYVTALYRLDGLGTTSDPAQAVVTGSLLAAIETAGTAAWVVQADRLCEDANPIVRAAALMARARMRLGRSEGDGAEKDAVGALAAAESAGDVSPPRWPDWKPPRRLVDQCRALRIHVATLTGAGLEALPLSDWRSACADRDDIDAERLVSLSLRFELGHRVVPADVLEQLEGPAAYVHGRRPSAWIHRVADPLVVEVARAWGIRGEPERSASLLRAAREEAVASADDPETVVACDRSLLWLCRRFRTTAYVSSVHELARTATDADVRAEAWLVLSLTRGEAPDSPEEAGGWHAWWQAQPEVSVVPDGALDHLVLLDRLEAWKLDLGPPPDRGTIEPPRLPGDRTAWETFLGFRTLVTSAPLLPAGPRLLVGRTALEVGEVLALRLPAEAADLLSDAETLLREGGDELEAGQALVLRVLALGRAEKDLGDARTSTYSRLNRLAPRWPSDWQGWEDRLMAAMAWAMTGEPFAGSSPELNLRRARPDSPAAWRRWLGTVQSTPGITELVLTAVGALVLALVVGRTGAAWGLGLGVVVVVGALVTKTPLLMVASDTYEFVSLRRIAIADHGATVELRASRRRVAIRQGFGSAERFEGLGKWQETSVVVVGRHPLRPQEEDLKRLGMGGRSRRFYPTILVLEVDRSLDDQPWEHWLVRGKQPHPMIVVRRQDPVSGGPFLPRAQWKTAGARFRGPAHLRPSPLDTPRFEEPVAGAPVRVHHVVGTPVETKGGWRIRTSDLTQTLTKTPRLDTGEALVNAEEIVASPCSLVVLQADPVDEQAQPLGAQRAGFIGFARRLLDGGVPAVLIVPPLADDAARDVVATIARRSARRRPMSAAKAVGALADVKAIVQRAQGEPGADQAALDTLLFLTTTF